MPEDYFASVEGSVPASAGAWYSLLAGPGVEIAPGIVSRPLAGESAMLTHVTWQKDAVAPLHAHEEEQLVLLIGGEVELAIGDQQRVMLPGDVAVIPPFARHGGRGLAVSSVAVEAFAPPRMQLLGRAPTPPRK